MTRQPRIGIAISLFREGGAPRRPEIPPFFAHKREKHHRTRLKIRVPNLPGGRHGPILLLEQPKSEKSITASPSGLGSRTSWAGRRCHSSSGTNPMRMPNQHTSSSKSVVSKQSRNTRARHFKPLQAPGEKNAPEFSKNPGRKPDHGGKYSAASRVGSATVWFQFLKPSGVIGLPRRLSWNIS
jgi:hypothetical protein